MPELQSVPGGAPPDQVRDHDKIFLILSYLGLFALIPLLTVKDSDYVRWHAKQGLAICGAWIAFSLAVVIVAWIPFIGPLIALASLLVHLGLFALSIYCIIKAMNGERWKVPVLGDLAQKF